MGTGFTGELLGLSTGELSLEQVSQDVTAIRALEGQRRLLEWKTA